MNTHHHTMADRFYHLAGKNKSELAKLLGWQISVLQQVKKDDSKGKCQTCIDMQHIHLLMKTEHPELYKICGSMSPFMEIIHEQIIHTFLCKKRGIYHRDKQQLIPLWMSDVCHLKPLFLCGACLHYCCTTMGVLKKSTGYGCSVTPIPFRIDYRYDVESING